MARQRKNRNTVLPGIILLLIGSGIILRQTVEGFPYWLTSWPMILIVIGIFLGLRDGFKGPGWLILIGLGTIFLADKMIPGVDIHRFAWPAGIIAVGLYLILSKSRKQFYDEPEDTNNSQLTLSESYENQDYQPQGNNMDNEVLDSVSVFGNAKKVVYSKNFRGGEVVNIFGGAEINCMQADLKGAVKLEIVQIFGGTKLIVPSSWTVRSNATSVFAGFEDKRTLVTPPDPSKVLVVEGTSIFGGIEIKSF